MASGRLFDNSACAPRVASERSEEHTSELQSLRHLVCRLLLEKKKVPIELGHRGIFLARRVLRFDGVSVAGGQEQTGDLLPSCRAELAPQLHHRHESPKNKGTR